MNPFADVHPVGNPITEDVARNLIRIRDQLIAEGKLTPDGQLTDKGRSDPTITDGTGKTIILNQDIYYNNMTMQAGMIAIALLAGYVLYKIVSK